MTKIILTLSLSLYLVGFVMPRTSFALGIDLKTIPQVKSYDTPPMNEFKAGSKLVQDKTPYGDKLLGYEFWVPKGWTDNLLPSTSKQSAEQKDISDSIFSMLAKHVSDPKNLGRSYLTIEGQKLGYEIKAVHWFVNQVLTKGLSLSALTEVSTKEVDGLYVEIIKDTSYVVRTRVIINGNKLLVVRYYLPQENYEHEKDVQSRVVESFKVLNPTNDKIEKQETFGFLDQSFFNYPSSWKLKEKPILTIERMRVSLSQERMQRDERVLEGNVTVNVVSKLLHTSISDEVKKFKEALDVPEYSVGKLIETIKWDKDMSMKFSQTQIYELAPKDAINMRQYEFLVSIMEGDDYYYIVSMIFPSRDLDFYGWARNMEVAKIVIESMRRYKIPLAVNTDDPYYDYLKAPQ